MSMRNCTRCQSTGIQVLRHVLPRMLVTCGGAAVLLAVVSTYDTLLRAFGVRRMIRENRAMFDGAAALRSVLAAIEEENTR
jgi:hypothetical protein